MNNFILKLKIKLKIILKKSDTSRPRKMGLHACPQRKKLSAPIIFKRADNMMSAGVFFNRTNNFNEKRFTILVFGPLKLKF